MHAKKNVSVNLADDYNMFHDNFSKQKTKEIDIIEATHSLENNSYIAQSLKVKSSRSNTALTTLRDVNTKSINDSGVGAINFTDGFETFKEQLDTTTTGRKDIYEDSFYAKNGVYNRFNKLIDFMKERKTEKNISAVKEYVASLQTNQNESI